MLRVPQTVTLVGFGAVGRAVFQRMQEGTGPRITHVVVREDRVEATQASVGTAAQVCHQVPQDARLLVECAGHGALAAHVLPALAAGIECAVVSSGALADSGLAARLADAALRGGTQLHLLAGAVGGLDAIAAARGAGLDKVLYTGRKPPAAWRGSHAEQLLDLGALRAATVFLDSTAREAARLYPKNANVAAIVALAGLGLDATRVRLVADPEAVDNTHEIEVSGAFGEMRIVVNGKPLADNPKTSALTVLSVVRFLQNRVAAITV